MGEHAEIEPEAVFCFTDFYPVLVFFRLQVEAAGRDKMPFCREGVFQFKHADFGYAAGFLNGLLQVRGLEDMELYGRLISRERGGKKGAQGPNS